MVVGWAVLGGGRGEDMKRRSGESAEWGGREDGKRAAWQMGRGHEKKR